MAARTYEFPDGSLYQVILSGQANGGSRAEIDVTLPPGALPPPAHRHRRQEETLQVVDGCLDVLVAGEWRTVETGASVAVPAGVAHTFRNRSDENVRFHAAYAPALGVERLLERLYWLSAMDRIKRGRSVGSQLYWSLLLDTHREEQELATPAARLKVRVLARLARLMRLRIDR